jgi:hypothetical protein
MKYGSTLQYRKKADTRKAKKSAVSGSKTMDGRIVPAGDPPYCPQQQKAAALKAAASD